MERGCPGKPGRAPTEENTTAASLGNMLVIPITVLPEGKY